MKSKFKILLMLAMVTMIIGTASAVGINNPNGSRVWLENLPPGTVGSGDSLINATLNEAVAFKVTNISGTTTDTLRGTRSVTLQFADSGSGWYKIYTSAGLQDSINASDKINVTISSGGPGILGYFYVVATSATKLHMIRTYEDDED